MKKLATLTLSAFLILPTFSHETKTGVIEDTFFNKPGITVVLRTLVRDGDSLKAVVDAKHAVCDVLTPPNPEMRTIIVTPFIERYWRHDDQKKYSQEMFKATIICGEHTLTAIYESPALLYYDLLSVKKQDSRKIKTYVRADDSQYIHKSKKPKYFVHYENRKPLAQPVLACVDNTVKQERYSGFGKPRFNMVLE